MRTCFTILIVFQIAGQFFAQNNGLYVGANASFQSCRIFCSTDADAGGILQQRFTARTAFGLDLAYVFHSRYTLQSGIIYSNQGQLYGTAGNENAKYKTTLDYFKIPLLLGWRSSSESRFGIYVQGGFQLSLLNKAESSRDRVFYYYNPDTKDVKDYYNSTNVDAVIAAGLDVMFHESHLRILVRADVSLNDIEVTDKKPGLRAPAGNMTIAIPQLSYLIKF